MNLSTPLVVLQLLLLPIVGWVAVDATRRGRSWFWWSLLVSNTSLVGLGIWLFARRRWALTSTSLSRVRHVLLWFAAIPAGIINAVVATLIVTFLFQLTHVEGVAMSPTLDDQDRLVISTLAYRTGEPQRGDVVMHRYPLDPSILFVKRIIAKEGDTIRSADGRVSVNEMPLQETYVSEEFRSHDNWGPITVPQGTYFVMGDHRNDSSDSRQWGPVPRTDVVGKVKARWWPLEAIRNF